MVVFLLLNPDKDYIPCNGANIGGQYIAMLRAFFGAFHHWHVIEVFNTSEVSLALAI